MASPIILIGTGTSVGKTHVAERLLRAFGAEGRKAYGYKPMESGVDGSTDSDGERLARASTFHVKREPARTVFRAPVSPHLAARAEGVILDLDLVRGEIARLALEADALVVELPGGAFSPFTSEALVAHFARSVPGARVVLVASDRLGVLHDLGAASRASAAIGLPLAGIVLSAPEAADASTGRNAAEIPLVTSVRLLAALPRQPADAPVEPDDPARSLARALERT